MGAKGSGKAHKEVFKKIQHFMFVYCTDIFTKISLPDHVVFVRNLCSVGKSPNSMGY